MPAAAPALSIASLVTSSLQVEEDAPIARVVRTWEACPQADGMAVVGGAHVRYLSRVRFFLQLGKRFGFALFENRPVHLLAEAASAVEADMDSVEAISVATQREPERIFDDLVVMEGGRFVGLVSMRSLLVHHKSLLVDGMAERAELAESNRQLREESRERARSLAALSAGLRGAGSALVAAARAVAAGGADAPSRPPRPLHALVERGRELLGLVDALDAVAAPERAAAAPVPETLDVGAVLQEILEAGALVAGPGVSLRGAGTPPAVLRTDPLLARRVIAGALNAVLRTTTSGVVLLQASADGAGLCIELTNDSTEGHGAPQLPAAAALLGRLGARLERAAVDGRPGLRLTIPPLA